MEIFVIVAATLALLAWSDAIIIIGRGARSAVAKRDPSIRAQPITKKRSAVLPLRLNMIIARVRPTIQATK
jgi:hypothetical protein